MLKNWRFFRIIESIIFVPLAKTSAEDFASAGKEIDEKKGKPMPGQEVTKRRFYIAKNFTSVCLLILIIPFVFLVFNVKNQDINQKLQSIPLEEKFFLEAFFRTLISVDNGSYVLFGDKPASFMIYEESQSHDYVHSLSDFPGEIVFSPSKRGFEVWQKYQHLFPSKIYSIIKIESCFYKNISAVFFVNKKRLLNILSKHFVDFQRNFPQFKSVNSLLQSILLDSSILREICNKHNLLLGIILGFGKENAALFERKMRIEACLFPERFHFLKSNLNQLLFRPLPRSGFATLEEELKAIEMKSDGVIENVDHLGISWQLHYPLGFLVDTEKTNLRKLRTHLRRVLAKANAAYNKGNFLFVTLANL